MSGLTEDKRESIGAPRALRFPVYPHCDESLPGLLARATREHVLESISIILKRAEIQSLHPGTVCLASEDNLRVLSRILRCDEEELFSRAHWYCTEREHGGPVTFGTAVVYREDLVLERRRIAPTTLQNSEYHRASWLIGLLPYCPSSLERLVNKCPRCPERHLGWRRSWGIGHCEICGELVPPSTSYPLEPELVEGYRLFADLISIEPKARAAALTKLPAAVRNLSPQTLLNCVLQLGPTLRRQPIILKRNAVSKLPAETLSSIVANGTTPLQNWPNALQDWSRSEFSRVEGNHEAVSDLRASLRRLGLPRSAGPEQVQIVRSVLPDMFQSFDRSFADSNEIVLGNEAAKITGLSLSKIRLLREGNFLSSQFEHGQKRLRRQYRKDEILNLSNALRGSKPLSSLEWSLGVPHYAIEQLCCLGLVERENHAGLEFLNKEVRLQDASIIDILNRIDRTAQNSELPKESVPIATAARRIGGRLKPWGPIIAALVESEIPYWMTGGPNYARKIRVRRADLVIFDDSVFQETDYPDFPFSNDVTQKGAEDILNIDAPQMRSVRAENLIEFKNSGVSLRADRNSVLRVAERFIATSEIAELHRIDPRRVRYMMKNYNIQRIAFGWERGEVSRMKFAA